MRKIALPTVLAVALALPFPASPNRAAAAPAIRLSVDAAAGRHVISPDIYGINFLPDLGPESSVTIPVDRWGGDTTETYNWKLGSANHGLNWYFSNFADCWEERFDYCTTGRDFRAYRERIRMDDQANAKTVLTLPMLGWVAKDAIYGQDVSCSFPADVYDPQDDHDPYNRNCGNGQRGGKFITDPPPDPTRAGTPIAPEFDKEWVTSLVEEFRPANLGGVEIYALGNEPGLWHETHHDFHPEPVTYDELWQKSRDLAAAVKEADPTAEVLGPAEWGWLGYFCSAADVAESFCSESSPDRAQHGGIPLSAWYLQQFEDYEDATGTRLLDYFDLHYYPQATYEGARYKPASDATRPLWDETYKDPSWIDSVIRLIPRMHEWIDANYPGTKLAITEYNMGLGVTKNKRLQTIIQADTLGLLGREGVDLAAFWPEPGSPIPWAAYTLYLSYDRSGRGFGSVGVEAVSSDEGKLSVYASQGDFFGGDLTIMVVNKTLKELRSRLSLSNFAHDGSASVFRYEGGGVNRLGKRKIGRDGFTATYPRRSVTLFVIPPP